MAAPASRPERWHVTPSAAARAQPEAGWRLGRGRGSECGSAWPLAAAGRGQALGFLKVQTGAFTWGRWGGAAGACGSGWRSAACPQTEVMGHQQPRPRQTAPTHPPTCLSGPNGTLVVGPEIEMVKLWEVLSHKG